MSRPFSIDGYAIVSADGMIASSEYVMPDGLHNDADKRFFSEALDGADLLVHGRRSYEGQPNSPRRKRFWMTHSVAALEAAPGSDREWRWNPAGISFAEACGAIGLQTGIIAILGGTSAYDLFLPDYRAFYLSRAGEARIGRGTPVFSAVLEGRTPAGVLRSHGYEPEPADVLDAANDVTLTRWVRVPRV